MALFDRNGFRALASAFMVSAVLAGCGSSGGGGTPAPNRIFTTGTPTATDRAGTAENDVWTIVGDTTATDDTALTIDGVIDGTDGDADEIRLLGAAAVTETAYPDVFAVCAPADATCADAVVASVSFSDTVPMDAEEGALYLQNIETITLDGGTVNGLIDVSTATAGITFNLVSGRVGPMDPAPAFVAITGSPRDDVFIVSGDLTGETPGLIISGEIQGGDGDEDEVRLVAGGVVSQIESSDFEPGEITVQAVEVITIDGGTVNGSIITAAAPGPAGITFNLMSGTINSGMTDGGGVGGTFQNDTFNLRGTITINGLVNGNDGADIFNLEGGTITGDVRGRAGADSFVIGSGITIGGTINGGADMDTLSLASDFNITSADLFDGEALVLTFSGGSLTLTVANIETYDITDLNTRTSLNSLFSIDDDANTFAITTDLTGSPVMPLVGVIDGQLGFDELQLNAGAVVASVAFSNTPPTGGAVHLRNVEGIRLDGGRVTGAIDASAAAAGVTFDLRSGTADGGITGSGQDDTFRITGDMVMVVDDADPATTDIPALVIGGVIDGAGNRPVDESTSGDELQLFGAIVASISFSDQAPTTVGAVHLQNIETITLNGGMVNGGITGSAMAETFIIAGDMVMAVDDGDPATTDAPALVIGGVINGAGGQDELQLNAGAVVGSIDFSNQAPTTVGAVHLQNIETITLDGGTVNGILRALSAETIGVRFNLIRGSVGAGISTGTGHITGATLFDNIFIVSGDLTGSDLTINGLIQGGAFTDTVELGMGGVVSAINFGSFSAGELNLRNVEVITIDGGTVNTEINAATAPAITFNLTSGTVSGNVTGSSNNDIFNLSGATVSGFLSGGDGVDIFNIESGTITGDVGGGAGDDTFTLSGGTVGGNVNGGAGDDTFTLSGGTVTGNINGEGNNDTFTLSSGTLTGTLNGGAGDDLIIISGNTRGANPELDLTATVFDGQGGDMDEFRLGAGGVVSDIFFSSTPSSESEAIHLQNVEIITINGGMIANSLITTGASTGLTINMNSGTISGGLAGSNSNDIINLRGGTANQNVLGNGGADTINLYSTIRIGGFLSGDGFGGGVGPGDVLRYMGAPASDSTTPNFFAARSGLAEDDDITNQAGDVRGFESQENVAAITSLGAGAGGAAPVLRGAGGAPAPAPGAPPVLRGAFGFEVLNLSPALNLYGAMSDALMQFGQQTAQGFALADLDLSTGRATSLVSKDSPFTKGRIWAHKITHSGNGKGSIGLNLTGLTARADSDYDYEMSLTQHGFDAPLAATRLGAFNLRAVSHTMTGVIETNVAEANVSGYGAGVALLWNSGAVARQRAKRARAPIISAVSASAHHHGLSAHITSLAGAYEVEAHTSPLNPRAVVNEVSEGSFSAINAVVSAGVADTRKLGHSLVLRTTADITWQTLSLDDFSETGQDGIIINFDKATRFTARVGAGLESEHWFSDVAFVHETSSGGTLSSGLRQDYRQDDGTAIEMKLGGKLADLATGLTLKAHIGLRTSLITSNTLDPSAHLALNWRF